MQEASKARRLHLAKLRGNACVEDIDFRAARGLDKSAIRALAQESAWVRPQPPSPARKTEPYRSTRDR
jgi:hypothetical protein